MVIQFQTSFTPKRTTVARASAPGFRVHGMNLFALGSIVIFLLTAGFTAAVFLYKGHLTRNIRVMDTELSAARKSFEPEFLDVASLLNRRIEGARELLNSHRALSPVFDVLEKKTLESVRFQDFTFDTSGGREPVLSMTGQANSFNAVALQSDVFGVEKSFIDPVFSDFTLNEDGDVIFHFRAVVDPNIIRYRETVIGAAGASDGAADTRDMVDEDPTAVF